MCGGQVKPPGVRGNLKEQVRLAGFGAGALKKLMADEKNG
jgi:hypothetical protein